MAKKGGLPVVEVSGKPYDMGKIAGRKCASKGHAYKKAISEYISYWTGASWQKAVDRAKLHLPFAEDFYPDFVDEIKGYADGARLPFEDVFTLCCHELLSPIGFRGCTDVAFNGDVTEDGHVLIAHNEDWTSNQVETVVLLHAKPRGKPEFVTTSYAGLLPSSGMNRVGLSLTRNALSPNDTRVGIPKVFPVRKALEAKRIGEMISFAMPEDRASSYNNICSDSHGEIYSLEGSASDFAILYALDGYLVHTNHYLAEKMVKFESDPTSLSNSYVRYFRALKLAEGQLGSVTIESIASILKDHFNRHESICNHRNPKADKMDISETVFSVIFDLTDKVAHVCKGHPCEGTYKEFSFKD